MPDPNTTVSAEQMADIISTALFIAMKQDREHTFPRHLLDFPDTTYPIIGAIDWNKVESRLCHGGMVMVDGLGLIGVNDDRVEIGLTVEGTVPGDRHWIIEVRRGRLP